MLEHWTRPSSSTCSAAGPGQWIACRLSGRPGDRPHTCAINVEEVERGLRSEGEHEAAARLFAGLPIVPLGLTEGVRAGTWRREHAARGRSLSQADCLVAAAAVTLRGRLATGNPKDLPMTELQVDFWPVGT